MDELIDQITTFLSDLPIGLIIFVVALLLGLFGREDKTPRPEQRREAQGTARTDPYARDAGAHTFASDERRAREERERREEEVLVFGGLDFGRRGSLFDEEGDRDSQWGKTKYGFDESEWGSAFGEKKNSEPIIR